VDPIEMRFWAQYKKYITLPSRRRKLFNKYEIMVNAISACLVGLFSYISHNSGIYSIESNTIFTASVAILGIIITGFAVYSTVSDREFIKFLHSIGVLTNLLFPFWLGSVFWAATIFISFISSILSYSLNDIYGSILLGINSLIFFSSITFTISLVGSTFRAAINRGELVLAVDSNKPSDK